MSHGLRRTKGPKVTSRPTLSVLGGTSILPLCPHPVPLQPPTRSTPDPSDQGPPDSASAMLGFTSGGEQRAVFEDTSYDEEEKTNLSSPT